MKFNMKAKPMRDRILVLPDPSRDDITAAGIIVRARQGIHESQKQFGKTGTVVAIGEAVDADQLKPGDRILFGEFSYPEYRENHTAYLILQDADVCGVIE